MKKSITAAIEDVRSSLYAINQFMFEHPELGDEEFQAVEKLTVFLADNDFAVETGIADRPTAFRAVFASDKPGPAVAFLCEYDALPAIGHGCGHNMIGTMSAAAGIGLKSVINSIGGRVVVLGTPAEETNGGKVDMVRAGIFAEIDVAMMLHPAADKSYQSGTSQAMDAIQFEFAGKASHAAGAPEKGINALDAAILTFNGINALREHLKPEVRIHGIIKEGGEAANIVPARAVAQFYLRAGERKYLDEIVEKVGNIARGAELMTGAALTISKYETSYANLRTNQVLSRAFTANLEACGVNNISPPKDGSGSLDMGDVSHVVPAIHPSIGLDSPHVNGHTREMAQLTVTDIGRQRLIQGAQALALTGFDIIADKELLRKIKEEFKTGAEPS